MSGKIDDPVDAEFESFPETPRGLGETFAGLALSFSGLILPPAAVAKILLDQFQSDKRFGRIDKLLEALRMGLKELEQRIGSDREKMSAIQA